MPAMSATNAPVDAVPPGLTRIDFYLDAEDRTSVVARIVRKARGSEQRIVILAPDEALAEQINRQLWTQPPTGFLPHCRIDNELAAQTPILIARHADQLQQSPHSELLINLAAQVPATFARFQRVIEVIGSNEDDKGPGRERFRAYRSAGFEIATHAMGGATQ